MKKSASFLKLASVLFQYAKRYMALIILAIVLMGLYAAISNARIVLVAPLAKGLQSIAGISLSTPSNQNVITNKIPAVLEKFIEGDTVRQTLLNIGWWFLIMSVLLAFLYYFKEYFKELAIFKTIIDIRNKLCAHLLTLSLRFFNEKKTGDLLSRLTNDVSITQSALNFMFGDIIEQPLMVLAGFVWMFILDWQLALIVLVFVPILIAPIAFFGKKIRQSRYESLMKLGDVTESMHQMFSGIRIVKSFQMEQGEIKELERENNSFLRKSLGMVKAKAMSISILELIGAGIILVVLFGAVYLVKHGRMDIPLALTFSIFLLSFLKPLRMLARSYNMLQESLSGVQRIFELMEQKPDIIDAPDAIDVPEFKKDIVFKNVSFTYGVDPYTMTECRSPALTGVNFSIKKGETIAIVGPTGAGKSTLLDLLCRFHETTEGDIEIDGVSIKKIKRSSLLKHIAIVGQDNFLFNQSIGDNIGYGKPDATLEELHEAARAAYIADFVEGLPRGYDTIIGERGVALSGGERQRLAIARAILKNPKILLLDEATSALDTESEKIVQSAINNLMKNRTTFIIAHRLSTVKHADRIIVLDKGEIVEEGAHEELVDRNGLYSRLARLSLMQ